MTPPRRSFRAHVQAVQAELAESTRRGGLANDAYGRVIEAQSAAIGVFPDFVDAVKSAQPQFTAEHLTTISGNLDGPSIRVSLMQCGCSNGRSPRSTFRSLWA